MLRILKHLIINDYQNLHLYNSFIILYYHSLNLELYLTISILQIPQK